CVLDPPPRDESALAEIRQRVGDILQRLSRTLAAVLVEIVLRHDAALFRLIEQKFAVGRQRAIAFVLAQQFEASPLQPTPLRLRGGQHLFGTGFRILAHAAVPFVAGTAATASCVVAKIPSERSSASKASKPRRPRANMWPRQRCPS